MSKQLGYGCMGLSAFYASARTTTEEQAIAVMKHAYDNGCRVFNSAAFYGPLNVNGYGHNLRLIGKFLPLIDRSSIQLMVKIGMDTRAPVEKTGQQWNFMGDYDSLLADVNYTLEQLGTDYIDIIVLCRVSSTPIEETVAAMKKIVESGKARYIGLSEASADTIRRAAAVTSIYCIEQEYSLWSRDIEAEIIPVLQELNIKLVAYSPLGRGFLTGSIKSREDIAVDPYDFRLNLQPRFSEENMPENLKLIKAIEDISNRKGCTVGQLALGWLLNRNLSGLEIIPIPGTSSIKHLDDNINSLKIDLSPADIEEINSITSSIDIKGGRYANPGLTYEANKAGAIPQPH